MVISRLIHSLSLELPLTPVPNTPLNGDYWTSEHSPCSTLTGYLTFILIIVMRGSPWHFSSIRCIKYLSTSRIFIFFFLRGGIFCKSTVLHLWKHGVFSQFNQQPPDVLGQISISKLSLLYQFLLSKMGVLILFKKSTLNTTMQGIGCLTSLCVELLTWWLIQPDVICPHPHFFPGVK